MDLNTVNQLLSDAELGITLDTHLMDQLMRTTSTQLLNDALHRAAANDSGAKVWVTAAINKARASQKSPPTPEQRKPVNQSRPAQRQQAPAPQRQQAPTATPQRPPVAAQKPRQEKTPYREQEHVNEEREFKGHKVYGAKFALYAGADQTRAGIHTVRLEGAKSSGPQQYNWDEKISIQLTQQELPHVACVLFGWLNQCEYKSHGPEKNKGFKLLIQNQQGKTGLFVNIMEAGKPLCAIPVTAVDLYYLRNLVLGQLMKNETDLDSPAMLASLKAYAGMLKE